MAIFRFHICEFWIVFLGIGYNKKDHVVDQKIVKFEISAVLLNHVFD